MTDRSCPNCGGRINPSAAVDTYDAWQARLARTDRALAEEAAAQFRVAYPDPRPIILARRQAMNDAITEDLQYIRQRDGAA